MHLKYCSRPTLFGNSMALLLAALASVNICHAADDNSPIDHTSASDQREIVGWVERIRIQPENLLLEAKLTPGSEGNVLHAEKISQFKKDGAAWVRFTLSDRKGVERVIERKLVGTSIFQTDHAGKQKRYLVEAGVCLSRTFFKVEFALADRSEFEQKVRIGRETIAGHFIIDPAKTKSTKPKCDPAKKIE